jgi:hypothetical protein
MTNDDDDYAGLRLAFEEGTGWFLLGRIVSMPAKMFCGIASSEDLRMIADFLLKVATEQSKEADNGDPAMRDAARKAAWAVAVAAEGIEEAENDFS